MIDDTQDGREPPAAPEVDVAALVMRLRSIYNAHEEACRLESPGDAACAAAEGCYQAAAALLAQQQRIAERAAYIEQLEDELQRVFPVALGGEQALAAARRVPPSERENKLRDAAEMLWIVLANVSGGDWSKQSMEWQEACVRWRDNYFAACKLYDAASAEDANG